MIITWVGYDSLPGFLIRVTRILFCNWQILFSLLLSLDSLTIVSNPNSLNQRANLLSSCVNVNLMPINYSFCLISGTPDQD